MARRARSGTVPSSARRFIRRQWARRLSRLRVPLIAAGVLLVLGAAVWAVGFSSLLDVREVTVRGVSTASGLSVAQVREAAAVPLGRPLARLDLDAIRTRVMELPPVRTATVERSWPHTVRIGVTERTPVGVWREGAVHRLVDVEGVPFRTVDPVKTSLPIVEAAPSAGRSPELRRAGARVVADLPRSLRPRVQVVRVESVESVVIRLTDGVVVKWGSAEEGAAKAQVLQVLLRHLPAKVYDVSAPRFPATRA
ncbi:cell division protein FtsQ/DivIB [Thermasporomyces composti]|uniref:cell division protein FtsQ/DivIB n=1 Tax=Thermasporomyces composti TaxID=696763 RepID=UPI001472C3FE|nr:FtsQ-type POTRA domain-containing protein [Thermasporomyces composti]